MPTYDFVLLFLDLWPRCPHEILCQCVSICGGDSCFKLFAALFLFVAKMPTFDFVLLFLD